jgi:hypothetical protein
VSPLLDVQEGRLTIDNRPVLAVFLDGLGADAIARMPFVSSQRTIRRLRTELGYSITCHASMYTGVRPDRHLLWFVWQRNPRSSPFRWLRPFGLFEAVDNLALRVAITKMTRLFVRTTSWFGVPYPVHVPWRALPELDIAERKLWSDPGYLDTAATIFDVWRNREVSFEIVGMEKGRAAGLTSIERWVPPAEPADVTYLFAGDVDHSSHAHGQDSDQVTELLGRVDAVIRRQMDALVERVGAVDLVLWSDHGHHDVERLDPFDLLERHGIDMSSFLYVIDTNFIRLWIADANERSELGRRLDSMGVGRVLNDADQARYRVRMPDDRYGNLIFYLDVPYAFSRTIWGFGRRLVSAHGYFPDHARSDGVFVSSRAAREGEVGLVDVAASLLELTGIRPEDDLDGNPVWTSG